MKNASYIFKFDDLQKMREDAHRALDHRFDEFVNKAKLIELLSTGKIDWLHGESSLFTLHRLFTKHEFINCDWDFFRIHFIGNEIALNKIIFLKETNQLPHVMKRLQSECFISKCKHSHIRLAQHFLDRFGKPLDTKVLRSSLNKVLGEKAERFIDKEIMGPLLKYK